MYWVLSKSISKDNYLFMKKAKPCYCCLGLVSTSTENLPCCFGFLLQHEKMWPLKSNKRRHDIEQALLLVFDCQCQVASNECYKFVEQLKSAGRERGLSVKQAIATLITNSTSWTYGRRWSNISINNIVS
ncbi:hypothetical protein P8452_01328 [Trifolium repens]|nr:hypothetical protein P8452_01328 [Trifolium repens]